jgi:pyridoxine/pyridoxamine 5'-phosphate oxidase
MTTEPDSPPTPEMLARARRVLDANAYLTLATADADGRPWGTPVWFAERDAREFVWVSRTARRHSQHLMERPEVALTVFDSTTPVGEAEAVYVEAVAGVVPDDELADALAIFSAKAEASGLPRWEASRVTGDAPFRLYRAVATRVWVLDEDEQRIRVR